MQKGSLIMVCSESVPSDGQLFPYRIMEELLTTRPIRSKACQCACGSNYAHEVPSNFQNSKCALRSNVSVLTLEQRFHPTRWRLES